VVDVRPVEHRTQILQSGCDEISHGIGFLSLPEDKDEVRAEQLLALAQPFRPNDGLHIAPYVLIARERCAVCRGRSLWRRKRVFRIGRLT
jgi:hypothetical protein